MNTRLAVSFKRFKLNPMKTNSTTINSHKEEILAIHAAQILLPQVLMSDIAITCIGTKTVGFFWILFKQRIFDYKRNNSRI